MVARTECWLSKPHLANNQNDPSNKMALNYEPSIHNTDPKEDERLSSFKRVLIRSAGIYMIVFTLTIFMIGAIMYLYMLAKGHNNACNNGCINTEELFARIENLERRLESFENSLPHVPEIEAQVNYFR